METRPAFHQRNETILEWTDIKLDLKALQETVMEDNSQRLAVRSQCLGNCGKLFKAIGVALPPTVREL